MCSIISVEDLNLLMRTNMKYKGALIVIKDCDRALKFHSDMFGFQLFQDNDDKNGNNFVGSKI